ncbi:MAG TPA: sigma-70 family RNA polymerase sigma factor [Terriglobales bacterium]|nr:sigma-70 family RNA polymerase sigma factor [Terriglobales bacterium]
MSAIKSGRTPSDREFFEKFLSYSRLVFHICLGFAADPLDAEELYQEVYLKAWNDLGSLRIHDSGREWLLKIARNTGLNHVRKKRLNPGGALGREFPLISGETPESSFLRQERHLVFKRAVRRLPKKYREAFVLREYGQLSYEEIAEALEVRTGTVMSRLNRARRTIQGALKEIGYGRDDEPGR